MQQRDYVIYDVFTDSAGAGNPLAVVFDAEGLDTAAMQRIAADFNFSETSFVTPAADAAHSARVRIFTPHYEMPFAGHPTVGTAIAIAERSGGSSAALLVLEENIGPVRCAVTGGEGAPLAEFDLPRLPERLPLNADAAAVGAALGLDPQDVGFENHRISLWTAGVPYLTVPVAGLAAAGKISFNAAAWREFAPQKENGAQASAYIYCRETMKSGSAFHARMLVPAEPPYEDPATGSAAAAFAGAVAAFDRPVEGPHQFWIEQGVEMGRPSAIRVSMDVTGGAIAAARVGGHAVRAGEGRLSA
jgi:trans-2,3-dihydro-3-hydroxyanthranilate isomerase